MDLDIVFSVDEAVRANFLEAIMNSFNCTYICAWEYFPQPFNCLLNLDGLYREDSTQPSSSSSSSGGFSRRLFDEYRQLILNVQNNLVPGHAFKNNVSFLELREYELRNHASSQLQRQFYYTARIKSSVFMGSCNGEIEIGFSNVDSQVNLAQKLKLKLPLFPISQASSLEVHPQLQNPATSASLKSLLMGNPETSSFFFNIPIIPHFTQSAGGLPFETSKTSAFKKYDAALPPRSLSQEPQRRSLLKRAIIFHRNLNLMRIRERIQASRSTAIKLLRMLAERKRREKIKEMFQALRSLLPPGTKKDKASVLATTREYLTKLKAEASALSRKNQVLEARISPAKERPDEVATRTINRRSNVIRVSHVSEDEGELIDLEISVNGGEYSMADMAIRVLQFLNSLRNLRVFSINGNTEMLQSSSLNRLTFRFSIQGGEWDESAFREAVRRVVADLVPQWTQNSDQ